MISKKRVSILKATFIFQPLLTFILLSLFTVSAKRAMAQAEVAPWGNITGIRISGQLMKFESSLHLVENDWSTIKATAMERQRPKYMRNGNRQIITTKIDSVSFTEIVEDTKAGSANVDVQVSSNSSFTVDGVFFAIALPLGDYVTAITKLNNGAEKKTALIVSKNTSTN